MPTELLFARITFQLPQEETEDRETQEIVGTLLTFQDQDPVVVAPQQMCLMVIRGPTQRDQGEKGYGGLFFSLMIPLNFECWTHTQHSSFFT